MKTPKPTWVVGAVEGAQPEGGLVLVVVVGVVVVGVDGDVGVVGDGLGEVSVGSVGVGDVSVRLVVVVVVRRLVVVVVVLVEVAAVEVGAAEVGSAVLVGVPTLVSLAVLVVTWIGWESTTGWWAGSARPLASVATVANTVETTTPVTPRVA